MCIVFVLLMNIGRGGDHKAQSGANGTPILDK
jgi:hypothetical protein